MFIAAPAVFAAASSADSADSAPGRVRKRSVWRHTNLRCRPAALGLPNRRASFASVACGLAASSPSSSPARAAVSGSGDVDPASASSPSSSAASAPPSASERMVAAPLAVVSVLASSAAAPVAAVAGVAPVVGAAEAVVVAAAAAAAVAAAARAALDFARGAPFASGTLKRRTERSQDCVATSWSAGSHATPWTKWLCSPRRAISTPAERNQTRQGWRQRRGGGM